MDMNQVHLPQSENVKRGLECDMLRFSHDRKEMSIVCNREETLDWTADQWFQRLQLASAIGSDFEAEGWAVNY